MINLSELNLESKILEPSVGEGVFIFGIFKHIRKEYKLSGIELFNWFLINVCCTDIDPNSISTLKKLLCEYFSSEFDMNLSIEVFTNIICCDSLFSDLDFEYNLVIGNPPYIRTKNIEETYLNSLRNKFETCKSGNIDIYYAFIEKFSNKKLCFIVPNSWIKNKSANNLKSKYIIPKLNKLTDFKEKLVFQDARTYTSIISLGNLSTNYLENNDINLDWKLISKEEITQINNSGNKFVLSGIATLSDSLFIVTKINEKFYAKYNNQIFEVEENILAYYLKLTKIKNNLLSNEQIGYIIFPYDLNKKTINENEMQINFPLTYKYLLEIKTELCKRDKGKIEKYEEWYSYGRKQGIHTINSEEIIILPLMIGNDCIPQKINITQLKGKQILFTSGFILDHVKFNVSLDVFLTKSFKDFLVRNGKVYPSKKELFYSLNSTQINQFISENLC